MKRKQEYILIKKTGRPTNAELLLFDDFILLDEMTYAGKPIIGRPRPNAGYLTEDGIWHKLTYEEYVERQKESHKYKQQMDLNLLKELGIIKVLNKKDWIRCGYYYNRNRSIPEKIQNQHRDLLIWLDKLKKKDKIQRKIPETQDDVNKLFKDIEELLKFSDHKTNLEMRLWSHFEYSNDRIAIPNIDYYFPLPPEASSIQRVALISLSNVPIPTGVPIQELLAFKKDSETESKLERFRWWMKKIAKQNIPNSELKDMIAESLFEFEDYMKRQKFKTDRTTIRNVLTIAAEVADSLFRAKFKQLVDICYQFEDRHIALLEAEDKAPGREVAFLSLIENRWPNSKPVY